MIMIYNNYALENGKKLHVEYQNYQETTLEKVNNWNYISYIKFLRLVPKIKMAFVDLFRNNEFLVSLLNVTDRLSEGLGTWKVGNTVLGFS